MLRFGLTAAAGLLLIAAHSADAQTIFIDGFETYGSTAAMNAPGAWGDNGRTGNPGSLITSGGDPGKYMSHPGGATAQHNFGPIVPTDAVPLVFEFDFKDPGSRVTGGLRTDGNGQPAGPILEIGRYNSVLDPETNTTVAGFAVRTVNVGSTPGNWVTFKGNPSVLTGVWSHLRATIRASDILFEVDRNGDGTVDANRVVTTTNGANKAYNVIRLGGPSDLSSTAPAGFDNVRVGLFQTSPGIFNTGVGATAARIIADSLDPHYTVATAASRTSPVASAPGSPTFVLPEDGFPIPPWVANDARSAWIAPVQEDDANAAPGVYDYSIFFDLTAAEAPAYRIIGRWATDNVGVNIYVNGTATGNSNPSSFGGMDPFLIDDGFVGGRNQLTFRVENAGTSANPTGLRVDVLLAAVPEPSTLALALVGLGGAALLGWRRAIRRLRL